MSNQNIFINHTPNTPKVELDVMRGKYLIKGKAGCIDPEIFWGPLVEWAKKFETQKKENSVFEFSFAYINSVSVAYLLMFIKALISESKTNNKDILFKWYVESFDSDMEDIINDFNEIIGNRIEVILESNENSDTEKS